MFESVDMAKVWKQYAKNVREHLEKNRKARAESMDPKRARFYG